MRGYRGMTTERAREVREKGHSDALEFAHLIGMSDTYLNDLNAKKDVIDKSGDAHSVKSGKKKWQLFLYSISRFQEDETFQSMNGIGQILVNCINAFPPTFEEYKQNKAIYKEQLKKSMIELKEKLQNKTRVKSFFNKALFNFGEVKYLTVKHNDVFHVFLNNDVNKAFSDNLIVENSKSRSAVSYDAQKVIFKYNGTNLAELEVRTDSLVHYKRVCFNMMKPRALILLFDKIKFEKMFTEKIYLYGNASKTFGRWK